MPFPTDGPSVTEHARIWFRLSRGHTLCNIIGPSVGLVPASQRGISSPTCRFWFAQVGVGHGRAEWLKALGRVSFHKSPKTGRQLEAFFGSEQDESGMVWGGA
jgi:hypothetical protein